MADLTIAMKGVIQSSTARTSSTYASTDLIQLYDSNNAPTIKISKDDLMAAVKASLPSLLSDQGTSGTAFPSIASGVLGSMTAANLASVLGVGANDMHKGFISAANPQEFENFISHDESFSGIKSAYYDSNSYICICMYVSEIQYRISYIESKVYTRAYNSNSAAFDNWQMISTDIPTFYKSYLDLSSLASALGASGSLRYIKNILKSETIQLAANSTYEVPGSLSGIIIISNESTIADTVIAATVYGTPTVTMLAPPLTGRFTLSKVSDMGLLRITNAGDATELSYTFISSGSRHNL